MITLFSILMILVFGKMIWWAFRATWCVTKVLLGIVFLPIVLIGLVCSGLVALALPLLLVAGVVALIGGAVN